MKLFQRLARIEEIVANRPDLATEAIEKLDKVWARKRTVAADNPPGSTQRSRAINDASAVRQAQYRIGRGNQ